MADITDPATRSRMMSSIRGRHTKPELAVRRALHMRGLRFRLHVSGLPGHPDLAFPRYGAVVFVHGCFWHQHGCANSNLPRTRPGFWAKKLSGNVERDRTNEALLRDAGWRVATVWECSIRQAERTGRASLYDRLSKWVRSNRRAAAF